MSQLYDFENSESDCNEVVTVLNKLARTIRRRNEKWWIDIRTGEPLTRNFGELIALMHSELSEALEANRKNKMDDKLPHRKGEVTEIVDAMVRELDAVGGLGWDEFGEVFIEKLLFNAVRPDHQIEHRLGEEGKQY